MRLAISGTHCSGKSTLIRAFLLKHSNYTHEPEAYEVLQELYGETFGAEPSADDFFRQLICQVEQLRQYGPGDRVVFERSPLDYIAYLHALVGLRRVAAEPGLAEQSIEVAKQALGLLDLIVFLPISEANIALPDEEDPELRQAMNRWLERITIDDELQIFGTKRPVLIEAVGSTMQRLKTLEAALR